MIDHKVSMCYFALIPSGVTMVLRFRTEISSFRGGAPEGTETNIQGRLVEDNAPPPFQFLSQVVNYFLESYIQEVGDAIHGIFGVSPRGVLGCTFSNSWWKMKKYFREHGKWCTP